MYKRSGHITMTYYTEMVLSNQQIALLTKV